MSARLPNGIRPELIPGLLSVAVFAAWGAAEGGVPPTAFYPGAVVLLVLTVLTVVSYRSSLRWLPPLVLVALAALAAFVAWNFASIAWADDRGSAWDGANRALLYLSVSALFAVPSWRASSAAIVTGAFSVLVAGVEAAAFLDAAGSANPLGALVADRFSEPTGYHNANAALSTIAMLPAFFLAARREVPWPLRGLMLAVAGLLFNLALLPQSRGWLVVLPIAIALYLAIVPGRVRTLTVLAPLAGVLALSAGPILEVFEAAPDAVAVGSALDGARGAILLSFVGLFAIGAAIGFADSRLEAGERLTMIARRAVAVAAAVAATAGAVIAIGATGDPVSWTGDRWNEFKAGEFDHGFEGSRLGQGLGSNRYDFWRVALDEFRERPLIGVGTENFAADYVRDRASGEEPLHPHSLPLRLLAQTGLIGTMSFAVFLGASLLAAVIARTRAHTPLARGSAAVALVVSAYWFLHSAGDWFWAFPAVSAPIFAWLGLAGRIEGARLTVSVPESAPPRSAARRRGGALIASGMAAVAILSYGLPWAAEVDVQRALDSWRANPRVAFDRLDRARDLNFLSARPDLIAGTIAGQLGRRDRARNAFELALERDPRNWYAILELAALDGLEGNRRSALRRLRAVAELNPREPLTEVLREGVLAGRPVTMGEIQSALLDRVCLRLGRTTTPAGCRPGSATIN